MINREVESIYVLFGARSTYSSIAKLTRLTFRFARYKIYTCFSKSCSNFPGNQHSSSSSFNRNTIENSNLLKNFPRILEKLIEISRKSCLLPGSIEIQFKILILSKIFLFLWTLEKLFEIFRKLKVALVQSEYITKF